MALAPGTRLGPYEIVSALGAGGMGEVYRANDTRLNREVAVKVLPEHLSRNPELRERFEREARAISQLSHPTSVFCTTSEPTRARTTSSSSASKAKLSAPDCGVDRSRTTRF